MTHPVLFGLTLFSALGCGLVSGIFFAFSTFVMKALARLPAPQAIAAMQSINVTVINPLFMSAFLGTGVSCLLLIVAALRAWEKPSAGYLLAGSLLYLVGTIGVTMLCNVPRNNALDAVDPAGAGASVLWARFLASWTAWNHVRTVAALAGAASLTVGLLTLE